MKFKEGWVTVLMPAYNRANYIEASIRSCLDQAYPKVEIVVVDDGSDDETPEKLKRIRQSSDGERLRIIRSEQNRGVCCAFNRALQEIQGEYFQFLDSDDRLHPEKIKNQIEAMKKSQAEAAVCGFRRLDGHSLQELRRDANCEDVRKRLSRFRGINNATALMRSVSLPENMVFNTRFDFLVDRDFFFRYFLTVRRWVYTPGYWVDYLQHENSITGRTKGRKVDYESYWESAKDYADQAAGKIPEENSWMLPGLARSLASAACRAGTRLQARRLAREAFRSSVTFQQKFHSGIHWCRILMLCAWRFFREKAAPVSARLKCLKKN